MAEQVVRLASVVEDGLCIASDDGEKAFSAIVVEIEKGNQVRLSFEGVEDLTSAFLNAAVGQLYGRFSEESLKACLLPPQDASPDDLVLLKRVVERAKEFFKDRERFQRVETEMLGDDDQ